MKNKNLIIFAELENGDVHQVVFNELAEKRILQTLLQPTGAIKILDTKLKVEKE